MSFKAFRRAQKRDESRPRGGGSKTPWQSYIFKLAAGEDAGIRVMAPPDDDFFDLKSHGWPKQICTAELPGFDGKCVYCYNNERDKEFRNKFYATVRTVACIVDFRFEHWDLSGDKPKVYTCANPEPNPGRVTCRHLQVQQQGPGCAPLRWSEAVGADLGSAHAAHWRPPEAGDRLRGSDRPERREQRLRSQADHAGLQVRQLQVR